MATTSQRRLIAVLVMVLVLVITASVAVLFLLPGQEASVSQPSFDGQMPVSTDRSGFDLTVLERGDYQALNIGLLDSGLLPVQPPAATGKANPFF
jgi:hypothetical protein